MVYDRASAIKKVLKSFEVEYHFFIAMVIKNGLSFSNNLKLSDYYSRHDFTQLFTSVM